VLGSVGHARRHLETALNGHRLAPAWLPNQLNLAVAYAVNGFDAESRLQVEEAIRGGMPSDLGPTPDLCAQLAARAGRHEEATAIMLDALPTPLRTARRGVETVRLVYVGLANPPARPRAIEALDALCGEVGLDAIGSLLRRRLMVWYSGLGALDQAYAIMNRSLDDFARAGTIGMAWLFLWMSELAPFRDDARFGALAERLKWPDYWNVYGPPDGYALRNGVLTRR
jgi:hypothetical protein